MSGCSAIICEFDPLHKGHLSVISRAKESGDVVLAVMSGSFTQRGECALFDKYSRAEAAVRSGVDLVLELPFPWSSCSAEFFALGGVSVAIGVGARRFVFGSESGDVGFVRSLSSVKKSEEYGKLFKELDSGPVGVASLHAEVSSRLGFDPGPNDKLASFYISEAENLGINAAFEAVKRIPNDGERHVSASDIRELFRRGEKEEAERLTASSAVPAYKRPDTLSGVKSKLDDVLFTFWRISAPEKDPGIFDASGGVYGRLLSSAKKARSGEEFYALSANKKYTAARLRRAALFSLLGVKKEDLSVPPAFSFLLAADGRGTEYLSDLSPDIKVLTKPSDVSDLSAAAKKQYELCRRADELFVLCSDPPSPAGELLRRSPFILK